MTSAFDCNSIKMMSMKQHKRTVYEQRKRDRKRLLKVKEIIDEVGHQIIKIKRITNQIK